MNPSLYSGSMEKLCVFLTVLKPFDSRFLSLESLFLLPALVNFCEESCFLLFIVLCSAFNDDFLLKKVHLKL